MVNPLSISRAGQSLALPRPREAAHAWIKRRIVMNEIGPGQTITELGVARELGCSQGTIREALMRLQDEGLVVRAGRRGTTVTTIDAEEADEIIALRRRIEMRGALRAVRYVVPTDIARLDLIQAEMDAAAAAGDAFALIEHDMAFHMEIFRLSGLQALEQILMRCMLHSHRFKLYAPGHQRPLTESARRHRVLVEHLESRDGPGLSEAIGHHIDTLIDVDGRMHDPDAVTGDVVPLASRSQPDGGSR